MHDRSDPERPARPRRRRLPRLTALVGALAVTLTVAACAGGGKTGGVASLNGSDKPTATSNASASRDPEQAALEFARCMRQHGIDVPDPSPGGGIVIRGGPGKVHPDDPKFKAAQQACQHYLPNGGPGKKPNAQQLERMVQFARCMRQHGIDVPDPSPGGGILVKGGPGKVNPDDPKFKAAQQACQHYLPNAGKLQGRTVNGGGSASAGGDR